MDNFGDNLLDTFLLTCPCRGCHARFWDRLRLGEEGTCEMGGGGGGGGRRGGGG